MGFAENMGKKAARGAINEMKSQARSMLKKYSPKNLILGKLKKVKPLKALMGRGRRGGRRVSLPFYKGSGRRGGRFKRLPFYKGSGRRGY